MRVHPPPLHYWIKGHSSGTRKERRGREWWGVPGVTTLGNGHAHRARLTKPICKGPKRGRRGPSFQLGYQCGAVINVWGQGGGCMADPHDRWKDKKEKKTGKEANEGK